MNPLNNFLKYGSLGFTRILVAHIDVVDKLSSGIVISGVRK